MEKIAALEDAIEKKSLVGIYSVFYTIAHGDPNFSSDKFRSVLEYVKSKNIDGLMQEFDGEEFESEEHWDEDYWALIASSLIDNFCDERIDHLEKVGKKVFPVRVVEQPESLNPVSQQTAKDPKGVPSERRMLGRTSANPNRRKITEEQKRGVKFDHMKRTQQDDGGFLSRMFGNIPRRK